MSGEQFLKGCMEKGRMGELEYDNRFIQIKNGIYWFGMNLSRFMQGFFDRLFKSLFKQ